MRTRLITALLGLLILAGCATASGTRRSWNPLDWMFGRKGAAVATAEAKQTTAETALVHAAQIEVVKTGEALAVAREEHPESRPVAVAQRTNTNAAALLNQREQLTLAEQQAALDTVRGLLSQETARREVAERAQQEAEGSARKLSAELGELRTRLEALRGEQAQEAANNLRLANELRAAVIWKWASTAGAVLLGIVAMAYRFNLGGLQEGVGKALAHLQHKYGTNDEDVAAMKAEIDAFANRGTQSAILGHLGSALAQKINPLAKS